MDSILIFIVVLGVLIFFHELGHFLVARLCGVGVERFSLGFGPRLLGKTIGRTDYRISLLPLGGYVKMVGDEPDAPIAPEDLPFSFTHKHVVKRGLIVAAGPLFNILLAILLFWSLFFFSGFPGVRPIVRNVDLNGTGRIAGIQENDLILSINGKPVTSWLDIDNAVVDSNGDPLDLLVDRNGDKLTVRVTPRQVSAKDLFGDDVNYFDIGLSGLAPIGAVVDKVVEGMPAQKAGLQQGDQVIAIDGRIVEQWETMHDIISASKGNVLNFKIRRGQDLVEVQIQPIEVQEKNLLGAKQSVYRIGIHRSMAPIPEEDQVIINFNLFEAFSQGLERTWYVSSISAKFFAKMIQGKVPIESIGGPIRIAQMARKQAHEGIIQFFNFMASISVQLAILNLLPIPVLDGGHLFFFLIEAVQRRPVSLRMRETAQQIGIFLLILLMIFVFYNDIMFTWFK